MSQESDIPLYLLLLIGMVLLSHGLVVLMTPKPYGLAMRSVLTGLVTTVVMHLYIIIFDEGVDQFIGISVIVGFLIGFGGGLALEAIRKGVFKD